MPRAKRGYKARRRRNRVLKEAKGFRGKRNSCFRIANESVQHARQHAYRGRKQKKRDYRKLWIVRINAAARINGTTYSRLINGLGKQNIELNRKMLAEIAINDPQGFSNLVKSAA